MLPLFLRNGEGSERSLEAEWLTSSVKAKQVIMRPEGTLANEIIWKQKDARGRELINEIV
jgi:hypothetical protein